MADALFAPCQIPPHGPIHYETRGGWPFAAFFGALSVAIGLFLVWRVERLGDRTDEANRRAAYLAVLKEEPENIVLFTDARGSVTGASPAAAAFFGCPQNDMIGATLAKYFGDSWPALEPDVQLLLRRAEEAPVLQRPGFHAENLRVGCRHRKATPASATVRAVRYVTKEGPQTMLAVTITPEEKG